MNEKYFSEIRHFLVNFRNVNRLVLLTRSCSSLAIASFLGIAYYAFQNKKAKRALIDRVETDGQFKASAFKLTNYKGKIILQKKSLRIFSVFFQNSQCFHFIQKSKITFFSKFKFSKKSQFFQIHFFPNSFSSKFSFFFKIQFFLKNSLFQNSCFLKFTFFSKL